MSRMMITILRGLYMNKPDLTAALKNEAELTKSEAAAVVDGYIINYQAFWHCILMLSKIISAIIGIAAAGLFFWKFKETPFCRP